MKNTFSFASPLVLFGLLIYSTAQAIITVNPRAPYLQNAQGTTGVTLYYAAYAGGLTAFSSAALLLNQAKPGYTVIDTTDLNAARENDLITVDIFSDQIWKNIPAGQNLVVTLTGSPNSTQAIPLIGAGRVMKGSSAYPPTCTIGTCQGLSGGTTGTNGFYSATYMAGSKIRLSFSLAALCSDSDFSSSNICAPNTLSLFNSAHEATIGKTLTASITATIGIAGSTNGVPNSGPPVVATSSGTTDQASFNLLLTFDAPTLLGTSLSYFCNPNVDFISNPHFYMPGNKSIYLLPANYGLGGGSAPIESILAVAKDGDAITPLSNDPRSYTLKGQFTQLADASLSTPKISHFMNSTNGTDHQYRMAIYGVNQAGIVSTSCWGSDPTHFVMARKHPNF